MDAQEPRHLDKGVFTQSVRGDVRFGRSVWLDSENTSTLTGLSSQTGSPRIEIGPTVRRETWPVIAVATLIAHLSA